METTNEPAPPLLGRLLDSRYRLDRLIARGGMATVFVATDLRLDRVVAVKVMHQALAEDPDFVARFTREAKAAARVSAIEVVAVHDQGTDSTTGLAYLVMEYVAGTTLRSLITERGALPAARAVSLMEPVLRALAAAHAAGLIHRDIKPENVLLGDDGRVRVTDFGLARAIETSSVTQTTGLLIGTVAYLSPEQVETGAADARSDVYAAGVLLWELLTGSPPYAGETPLSVAYRHVHEDVPAPSTLVASIPPELDALVVAATRREPSVRPSDGAAFLRELLVVQASLPPLPLAAHPTLAVRRHVPDTPAPPHQAGPPTGGRRTRRPRRSLIAAAVVVVLALASLGGGYFLGGYRHTQAPSLLGLVLAEATTRVEAAGLTLDRGADKFHESVPAGAVLSQDPGPQERVRKGGTVVVQLSKGPDRSVVPAVKGMDLEAARAALSKLRLRAVSEPIYVFSGSIAADRVVRTDPPAGTKLRPGTAVQLVLSKGPQPVAVPNVVGERSEKARKTLEDLAFRVAVTEVFSDTVDAGKVAGQSPSSGTAPKGSTVSLQVSKGPDVVTVPDVVGMKEAEARSTIEEAGLKVRKRSFPGGSGKVRFTDPGAGKTVRRGSTVTIFVY